MAEKRTVAYKSDRGQIPNTGARKGDLPANVAKMLNGPDVTRNLKGNFLGGFGDERTGIRKPTTRMPVPAPAPAVAKPKPKPKPAQVISTTVRERTTPVSAKAAAPARMAVNRATGDTTGFTTGKTTGSTVTKSGTAYKTPMTGLQRMNQNAFNKGGVAGPSRSTGGSKSAGPSRSTGGTRASNPSRGDVGAGRRGGGR
jgi:hypothetical protein